MINENNPDFNDQPHLKTLNFIYEADNIKKDVEISIITPFYNASDVFWDTYHCVINQSFQNFEWIIIDDCSTNENSLKILHKLQTIDSRVKVIKNNTNLGPSGARNHGITKAKGNYLFFVDCDDLIELTIIEKYWIFLIYNSEFSFCNAWHIGFSAENYLWKNGFETGNKMLHENVIQPTFMARKELFDVVLFDETITDGFEDWDFWLKCAKLGYWGYTINEYLYWYRRTENITEKWKNWDNGDKMKAFKNSLIAKYDDDFKYSFPTPARSNFQRGTHSAPLNKSKLNCNNLKRNKKKRLLFFIPWMSMGGADRFNVDLVKGLGKENWEITIVTTKKSENNWHHEFSKYTSDIFILENYTNESNFNYIHSYLISSRDPDVILMSNSEFGYYSLPYLKLNFPNIPIADYNHMEEDYWNNGGHPRQGVIYQGLLSKNIVSSSHLKKWMTKQGADNNKIEVVTTNSDFNNLGPSKTIRKEVREELGLDEDLCVIVFSGRITAQKQPKVLINTIKHLNKKIKNGYLLLIAGNGPDFNDIKLLSESYHLSNKIRFLGEISNSDNLRLLQAADIFFLPSLWEGISLAIYEAMTAGLAIVGANVGGQKELVNDDCGYLIERSTESKEAITYSDILYKLVANPETYKSLGKNSRKRIESKFGMKMMIENMNSILSNLSIQKEQIDTHEIGVAINQVQSLLMIEKNISDQLWNDVTFFRSQKNNEIEKLKVKIENYNPNKQYHYEYDTLKTWYHNEYEVLPLWYKRFGHIIKVLTGKRKFKSLIK